MIWRDRKLKNRRLGREFVLDVKLRSSQVRAARLRILAIGVALLFVTVFGVYLLWRTGDWALDRFLYRNSAFAIQEIDIQSDGVIAAEEFRKWAGVKQGANLLALDLGKIKRDLELVPFVQAVSVDRILPKTLRIRITEREPMAQVNIPRPGAGGGVQLVAYKLDPAGWVMTPLQPRQLARPLTVTNENIPILTGVRPADVSPGRKLDSFQVQTALDLISAFDRSPVANFTDIKSIDVSPADVLIVTTTQGSEITFGMTGIERQLLRWDQIAQTAERSGKAIATLDLAVSNNIPAKWMEAALIPPITQKVSKMARYRKKHV